VLGGPQPMGVYACGRTAEMIATDEGGRCGYPLPLSRPRAARDVYE